MPAHKLTPQPNDGKHLVCVQCKGDPKPYSDFYHATEKDANFKTYDGRCMPCRACHKANKRAAYAANPNREARNAKLRNDPEFRARENAQKLARYHANREKICAERRAKRASLAKEEKDRLLAKQRDVRLAVAADPVKKAAQQEYMSEWIRSPRGRAINAAHRTRRRASCRNVELRLTPKEWLTAIDAYGTDCIYCEKDCEKPTMDHLIPLVKGGPHSLDNVVPACLDCNTRKGKLDVDDFLSRNNLNRGKFLIKRLAGLAQLTC